MTSAAATVSPLSPTGGRMTIDATIVTRHKRFGDGGMRRIRHAIVLAARMMRYTGQCRGRITTTSMPAVRSAKRRARICPPMYWRGFLRVACRARSVGPPAGRRVGRDGGCLIRSSRYGPMRRRVSCVRTNRGRANPAPEVCPATEEDGAKPHTPRVSWAMPSGGAGAHAHTRAGAERPEGEVVPQVARHGGRGAVTPRYSATRRESPDMHGGATEYPGVQLGHSAGGNAALRRRRAVVLV